MKYSILICSYNRGYLIKHCLDALLELNFDKKLYEIILIDNNSNDGSAEIMKEYASNYDVFNYMFVEQKSLSIARNEGAEAAKGDYIIYIDDDALISSNYLTRLDYVIEKYAYKVIGGVGYPWYHFGKPKWMREDFGYSTKGLNDVGVLQKESISGFSMCFERNTLLSSSLFSIHLGMSGDKVAYGEETALIFELRKKGVEIAFDPKLEVKHLVAKHKLKLSWHLQMYKAHGRDNLSIWGKQKISSSTFLKVSFFKFWKIFPKSVYKFLFTKNYYFNNMILDTFQPIFYLYGKYNG